MLSPPFVFSFLRRFAIALVAVVVLTAVVFKSADAYGKRKFNESPQVHIDQGVLKDIKPGQPANYLMLGSDVRPANETPEEKAAYGSNADAGGQRSDVMMVLHVDPAGKTGQLVSFPRDMMVQIPGYGRKLLERRLLARRTRRSRSRPSRSTSRRCRSTTTSRSTSGDSRRS